MATTRSASRSSRCPTIKISTPRSTSTRETKPGNESSAAFDYRIFPKDFRRSQIVVGDAFLRRVVPLMVNRSPDLAEESVEHDSPIEELVVTSISSSTAR